MRYQSASEKTAIIPSQMVRPSIDQTAEIKSSRRKVIIFVSFQLFVMTIYFTLQMVIFLVDYIDKIKITRGILIESIITLISITYLIAFLIVFIRYFPAGILIFAWLTLLQLIGGSFLLILAIMAIIYSLSSIPTIGADIIFDISFSFVGIAMIVLSVLTILYSMNLLKLMKR